MRHGDKINNLGRTTAHRKALMSNLSKALIQHKRITTTTAKAKALRVYIEPLITKAKNDTTQNRRTVFRKLQDKEMVTELFNNIGLKVADRPGGYTRIIKIAPRRSDAAEMAMIELVDYNTVYAKDAKTAEAKKTRRSRRGGKPTSSETQQTTDKVENTKTEEKVTEAKVEETKAEEPKVEEPKAEEPKAEVPKVEEPKAEEPKSEEPKNEENNDDAKA